MGGRGVADDELLLRWLVTKEEFDAMRAAGPSQDPVPATRPILELLENLSKRKSNQIFIRTEKMTLSLNRRQ
jgi:hypothetical protein